MAFRKYRPRKLRVVRKKRPARKMYRKARKFARFGRKRSGLSSIKVKCNGQVQPYARYISPAPYWKSKLERLYFTASKNCARQLYGTSMAGANGAQGIAQQFIWSRSEIVACLNTITGLAPGTTGQVKNTSRVYLQKCIANYTFTNSSNAPIEFDIYVFNSKRDAEDSLVTIWESGVQDMIGTALPDTNSV